ncbi:RNA 2',3'-cyclic phosphodiesterase [bacterium]|nr:RNA 2',3'-cyclic phosphodiesterase [bacterium]
MKKRIFIAINLPDEVKQKLLDFQKKWSELPVRWVKKENLHLTLNFLGYIFEKDLNAITKSVEEISQRHQPFFIELDKIDFGARYKNIPRLIWVEGKRSQELISLKKDLDQALHKSINFIPETRDFLPHITLARLRKWDWQRIEPDERPEICEYISEKFEVKSIEIMESRLKRGGAQYSILKSFQLKSF